MNRRDFLRPRRLAHSAGQVLAALEPPPAPVLPEGLPLLRMARKAMATAFEIILPFGTPGAVEWGEAAFELLDALEEQLTVYRDSSEVSRLNRLAPAQAVPVEDRLFDLLAQSARLTVQTEGAFDVSAGALIKAWGFFRGPPRVPSEAERAWALERTGMRWVSLARLPHKPEAQAKGECPSLALQACNGPHKPEAPAKEGRECPSLALQACNGPHKPEAPAKEGRVRYLRPGLEINLGSIGKGYALDRLAAILREEAKVPAFLLHGGHSSVYARGSPGGESGASATGGWPIAIRHPWRAERLGVVRLRDRALGTSAATFRHLEHQGRTLGHILDPRTGWPAEALAQASVLAPSAAEADALATAFYILGIDKARAYCAAHPEVAAVLLPQGDGARPVVVGPDPDLLDPCR
jgi:thiamine biosynthesis lipoprotein